MAGSTYGGGAGLRQRFQQCVGDTWRGGEDRVAQLCAWSCVAWPVDGCACFVGDEKAGGGRPQADVVLDVGRQPSCGDMAELQSRCAAASQVGHLREKSRHQSGLIRTDRRGCRESGADQRLV